MVELTVCFLNQTYGFWATHTTLKKVYHNHMHSLSKSIDKYSGHYDSTLLLSDFNLELRGSRFL